MKYSFKELVDISKLQKLTDELFTATAIPSSIIAMDGEILEQARKFGLDETKYLEAFNEP